MRNVKLMQQVIILSLVTLVFCSTSAGMLDVIALDEEPLCVVDFSCAPFCGKLRPWCLENRCRCVQFGFSNRNHLH